jgi:hypothetical protein
MHGKSCPFSAHKFNVSFLLYILFHAWIYMSECSLSDINVGERGFEIMV